VSVATVVPRGLAFRYLVRRFGDRDRAWPSPRLALALAGLLACSGSSPLVISEFVASNTAGLEDIDGETSDWIELHNGGTTAASLSGWCLTDDPRRLDRWCFPNVSIPAHGYLVVFASGKQPSDASSELHSTFKLKSLESYLGLVTPRSRIAHEFAPYPNQRENVSFGLTARGTTDFLDLPTPGAPNR
jgi:Lamin Tail Domain